MPVHIHKVGAIAHEHQEQPKVAHPLRRINFPLLHDFLLTGEVLKYSKFVVLVWISLGTDIIGVVRPVLDEVG